MSSPGKKFRGRGRKVEITFSKKLRRRAKERERRSPPDEGAAPHSTEALQPSR